MASNEPGEEKDPPEDSPKPGEDGKFSQDDLKRIAAREKREGKQAGRREMLKDLGLESEDDLKKLLDDHRAAEEKSLSDADKAKKEAEKDKAAAASERASARQDRFDARCERALLKADCDPDIVGKIVKLVELEWESSQDVPDQEIFEDAVKELKSSMPQLFIKSEKQEDPPGGPPPGDPGSGKKGGSANPTGLEAGAGLLAQRHPKVKTS